MQYTERNSFLNASDFACCFVWVWNTVSYLNESNKLGYDLRFQTTTQCYNPEEHVSCGLIRRMFGRKREYQGTENIPS
jgi:hypothetical protein